MKNIPKLKLGILAASRDCFPVELSRKRRIQVAKECRAKKIPVVELQTVVENETHVLAAEQELRDKSVNALVIFLGNFGPEGPTTLLAQKVDGPAMFAAAAEETGADLINGRGRALCGMLHASYNTGFGALHP